MYHKDGSARARERRWSVGGIPWVARRDNAPPRAFAIGADRMQPKAAAIDGDGEAVADQAPGLYLKTFDRAVHIADRAAATGFFPEHMPGFERRA